MATNVIMPSLGFDMTQGKLLRWLKKEGDAVKKDEPVAEIETEKAAVEIQATVSGVLLKILLQPGETVPVGTVMGIIGEANEQVQAVPTAAAPVVAPASQGGTVTPTPTALPAASDNGRVKASPIARKMAAESGIDLATLKGTGPGGRIEPQRLEPRLDLLGIGPW